MSKKSDGRKVRAQMIENIRKTDNVSYQEAVKRYSKLKIASEEKKVIGGRKPKKPTHELIKFPENVRPDNVIDLAKDKVQELSRKASIMEENLKSHVSDVEDKIAAIREEINHWRRLSEVSAEAVEA